MARRLGLLRYLLRSPCYNTLTRCVLVYALYASVWLAMFCLAGRIHVHVHLHSLLLSFVVHGSRVCAWSCISSSFCTLACMCSSLWLCVPSACAQGCECAPAASLYHTPCVDVSMRHAPYAQYLE